MKLLLDTQTFIWLVNDDKRLGKEALQFLQDTSNQVCISYFSFFEMRIKASIGKLNFDNSILEDLPGMGVELAMSDIATLKEYKILNPDNKDPFDNVLMTIALGGKYTLVTSDAKILAVSLQGLDLLNATK